MRILKIMQKIIRFKLSLLILMSLTFMVPDVAQASRASFKWLSLDYWFTPKPATEEALEQARRRGSPDEDRTVRTESHSRNSENGNVSRVRSGQVERLESAEFQRRYMVDLVEQYRSGARADYPNLDDLSFFDLIRAINTGHVAVVGPSGVGKTTLMRALAYRISIGDVPDEFKNKKIFELDVNAFIAGTATRGEPEERMRQLGQFFKEHPNDIIVIDEVHRMANRTSGEKNYMELLKQLQTDETITARTVIITTEREFNEIVLGGFRHNDGTIERRYQIIDVKAKSAEDNMEILTKWAEQNMIRTGIVFDEDVLYQVAKVMEDRVHKFHLPYSAINLLNRVAKMRLTEMRLRPRALISLQQDISNKERQLRTFGRKVEEFRQQGQGGIYYQVKISRLQEELEVLRPQLRELEEHFREAQPRYRERSQKLEGINTETSRLTRERENLVDGPNADQDRLIEIRERLLQLETERLNVMREYGTDNPFGHLDRPQLNEILDEAILTYRDDLQGMTPEALVKALNPDETVAALQRIREVYIGNQQLVDAYVSRWTRKLRGWSDPNRPWLMIGVFGPPGQGKTYIAEVMNREVGGGRLKPFNGPHFQADHEVTAVFHGAPPGYTGYEEGGQLVNLLAERPRGVVLFDEADKAHSSFWEQLLQLRDDVTLLTDNRGVSTANAPNYAFQINANFLQDLPSEEVRRLNALSFEERKQEVLRLLNEKGESRITPEIMNGLDELIIVERFDANDLAQLFRAHHRNKGQEIFDNAQVLIKIDDDVFDHMPRLFMAPNQSARDVRRVYEQSIIDEMNRLQSEGLLHQGDFVHIYMDQGNIQYSIRREMFSEDELRQFVSGGQ